MLFLRADKTVVAARELAAGLVDCENFPVDVSRDAIRASMQDGVGGTAREKAGGRWVQGVKGQQHFGYATNLAEIQNWGAEGRADTLASSPPDL